MTDSCHFDHSRRRCVRGRFAYSFNAGISMNRRRMTPCMSVSVLQPRPLALACATAILLFSAGEVIPQEQAPATVPAQSETPSTKPAKNAQQQDKRAANPDAASNLDAIVVTGIQ